MSSRISVPEIAERLSIGRMAVYALLDRGIIPGIRLGRRWIVTRHAYEQWERTCGMKPASQAPDQQRSGVSACERVTCKLLIPW